jgi:hypothetical protein
MTARTRAEQRWRLWASARMVLTPAWLGFPRDRGGISYKE